MNRRDFIHAATASVVLPAVTGPCAALGSQTWHYGFFDERFEKAWRVAATWTGSERLIAVHGDITHLWSGGLDRAIGRDLLHLCGLTTESFLFCLRVLAGEHADLDMQVSRCDWNLLIWTMQTTPKGERGAIRHG